MTLQEQYELVKKAVDNDHLKELFLGAPGYEWGNLKHIPANVATDIGAIIEHGLYTLYSNGNKDIPQKLEECVYALLNGGPTEIWTAYQVLWSQNWDKHHGKSPFCIINDEILANLKNVVLNNQEELVSCKDLVGWNLKEGLWEDIARLERNLRNKHGVGLIWGM